MLITEQEKSAVTLSRRVDDPVTRKDGQPTHYLPALPYRPDALEPAIDARTMALHHDRHHAAYVENLNASLEPFALLRGRPATWLILNGPGLPADIRTTVLNNAGGHVNHSLFWRSMSPAGGGEPANLLADAINRDFGSIDGFKKEFNGAGAKVFGSGWVWLVRTRENRNRLAVVTTPGHGNPLTAGHFAILLNDVWEHAYYLKHQNRRDESLEDWWSIVNWEEAGLRFRYSDPAADRRHQGDTGQPVP